MTARMSDTEKVDEGFLHFSAEERWLVFSLTCFHVCLFFLLVFFSTLTVTSLTKEETA